MKLAVMQPYFIPYAGYFRLLASTDLFVIYDDVQFNRRGYVHRNKLLRQDGKEDWLTLPLKKTKREDTMICDLEWAWDANLNWEKQIRKFPVLGPDSFIPMDSTPVDFIVRILEQCSAILNIPFNVVRSSKFHIPKSVRGQARIMEICRRLKAKTYVNSPGGKKLYDKKTFDAHNIDLQFLPDYNGDMISILQRLYDDHPDDIRREIMENI